MLATIINHLKQYVKNVRWHHINELGRQQCFAQNKQKRRHLTDSGKLCLSYFFPYFLLQQSSLVDSKLAGIALRHYILRLSLLNYNFLLLSPVVTFLLMMPPVLNTNIA